MEKENIKWNQTWWRSLNCGCHVLGSHTTRWNMTVLKIRCSLKGLLTLFCGITFTLLSSHSINSTFIISTCLYTLYADIDISLFHLALVFKSMPHTHQNYFEKPLFCSLNHYSFCFFKNNNMKIANTFNALKLYIHLQVFYFLIILVFKFVFHN